MVSLKEGRGKTLAWVFAGLGFVAGFLLYDLTASSKTLTHSDCEQLAPYVDSFFSESEEFIAKNPKKWYRIEELYNGLFEELAKYLPRTDQMEKHGEALRASISDVAAAIYGFNPNARNRERLGEATERARAQLKTLEEVCR